MKRLNLWMRAAKFVAIVGVGWLVSMPLAQAAATCADLAYRIQFNFPNLSIDDQAKWWENDRRFIKNTCNMTYHEYLGLGKGKPNSQAQGSSEADSSSNSSAAGQKQSEKTKKKQQLLEKKQRQEAQRKSASFSSTKGSASKTAVGNQNTGKTIAVDKNKAMCVSIFQDNVEYLAATKATIYKYKVTNDCDRGFTVRMHTFAGWDGLVMVGANRTARWFCTDGAKGNKDCNGGVSGYTPR